MYCFGAHSYQRHDGEITKLVVDMLGWSSVALMQKPCQLACQLEKEALNDTLNAAFVQVLRKLHYNYRFGHEQDPKKDSQQLVLKTSNN